MAQDRMTTRLQGRTVEKVGVIIVHGIGEQRRFEFLEGETRKIVDAIIANYGTRRRDVTPTLTTGAGDAFLGEQRSWTSGSTAPLRTLVELSEDKVVDIAFHEVWWADINEKPTLGKQLRFWAWGLGLAGIATHIDRTLPGATQNTRPPDNAGALKGWNRVRMAFVSSLFGLSAFSVAFVNLVLKQLGFAALPATETIINYLSGVKLYNQNLRAGGSPMDGPDEPPRAAIRRRMIRTMIDVARGGYDRWYILAHSLGTVVAWNGLMETAQALPNYLDQQTWDALQDNPLRGSSDTPFDINAMMPNRPLWLDNRDLINREVLFEKFRGILTYGSPLERFCALWSALVPVNCDEYAFRQAEWVNVYDPTDPVGTWLADYNPRNKQDPPPDRTTLKPNNYPCRASWLLLYSHLCYLKSPRPGRSGAEDFLVNQIARWLVQSQSLAGQILNAGRAERSFWLPHEDTLAQTRRTLIGRQTLRYAQAAFAAVILTALTLLSLKYVIGPLLRFAGNHLPADIASAIAGFWTEILKLPGWLSQLLVSYGRLWTCLADFIGHAALLWLFVLAIVGAASGLHYILSTSDREQLTRNIKAQESLREPHFR